MAYKDPDAGKREESYATATIAPLTHAVGTADGTVDDVGASFNQATLNNNFKELTAKVNAILAQLTVAGIDK